jgi:NAD(P)H-dependent flavin oxidoreductase YrpB (nitropropane dioxygenase family)
MPAARHGPWSETMSASPHAVTDTLDAPSASGSPVTPISPALPALGRLDRAAIEGLVASGRRLLVQGGMGIHASDGLAGKVAAHRGARLVGAGTISAVVKSEDHLRREIRRARAEAGGGFVGVNLMAAINKREFESSARIAIEERVSFIVQGAGISREIIKWCRAGGIPFAGIVSSGRLAAMYEKWGADFLVAEGAEAGGHIGDIGHPLPSLVDEVVAATSLPVVAAGGVDASDVARYFAAGAAGVQMASRFLASADGDVHPNFKQMHLGRTDAEITLITSCERFPPRSKAWYFGPEGFQGRKKACVECLAEELCLCRASQFRESFCITDALLAAAVQGDMEKGLFYTGSSITRIPEQTVAELPTVQALLDELEGRLAVAVPARIAATG